MLALNYGFTVMFFDCRRDIHTQSGIDCIYASICGTDLRLPYENALSMQGGWQDSNVRMLFVASTLMWTCNTMYIIDMPLWIGSEYSSRQTGGLMGTALSWKYQQ